MQAFSVLRIKRATTLLCALTACAVASADSVTYSFTHNGGVSDPTTWFDTPSLSKFDPLLGTLTSVDLFLGGSMVTHVIDTASNTPGTVTRSTTGSYRIYTTGMSPAVIYQNDSSVYNTNSVLAANQTKDYGNYSFAFADLTGHYTDANTLARFMGPGSINLMFYATAATTVTTTGNANGGITTTATGSGFVRYNYTGTPTPEPASFAALSIGAVALVRRRKGARR